MNFKFKIQRYQTDAVENTVSVFAGQPSRDSFQYRRDLGKAAAGQFTFEEDFAGYRNSDIELDDRQLLENIQKIQDSQDIKQSAALVSDLGRLGLDIEMETGTGKTYVYIKTMFELNKRYGWNKFIDVIAANRPIIIMDEPQKMEGQATQKALRRFNPLFELYYSATHKTQHNCVYALDALDAFKQKLVKKIQVKGFEVKNLKGTSSHLYLDDIILSKDQPPMRWKWRPNRA